MKSRLQKSSKNIEGPFKAYNVVHEDEKRIIYAKKNCNRCYGKGVISRTFPSPVFINGTFMDKLKSNCTCVKECASPQNIN